MLVAVLVAVLADRVAVLDAVLADGIITPAVAESKPSGHFVLSLYLAPLRSTPLRSAPLRSAPLKSAPLKSAPRRSAFQRMALLRSASVRSASRRTALFRTAPLRSAALRSASRRLAPPHRALGLMSQPLTVFVQPNTNSVIPMSTRMRASVSFVTLTRVRYPLCIAQRR